METVRISILSHCMFGAGRLGLASPHRPQQKKRGQLRAALQEIAEQTRSLHGGYGWSVDQMSSGLVLVSRPKRVPLIEQRSGGNRQ
ncbi:hypothetical protein SAMN05444506_102171 [Pseudomonas syringae]|uniref:Plasmid replication-like protein n=2 Tax=Pseudomonas syringae group genomosp. 3 TaxID=251701 RepID=A0A3M3MMJ3_9PSED|nr:Plasmid replication-like protein [Pseudomonas syringae pv. apii]RMN49407.1 Plasmid replication-like protein [Pseudomonas syringae pv. apii]RMN95556.1 Plasmid replication-like protein [Pseudomonas syringae pv. apii]RMV34060.1 Plasmid replication-like protein [Pseudomonas syringae pv. maculicola]SDY25854.1 hypothetical protein SAMN05444506_102171 [Pseudomonas syringae]